VKYVEEPQKKIDVIEEVDVCVVGGGPGGMPAAIAAARLGLDVLIVESYGFFGGLATTGLMGPLFGYASSAMTPPRLILGGIPVEMVRKLQQIGGAPADDQLKWWAVRFDPELYKHVCDWLVTSAGVRTLFHSYASNVVMDGDRIDALIIECKSGRKAIKAKIFIDATGDGDLAYWAGEDYTQGRKADGLTQPMGTKFIIGGVAQNAKDLLPEYQDMVWAAIASGKLDCYHPVYGEVSDQGVTLRSDERTPTMTRFKGDATNVRDLTAAEFKIRRDSYDIVEYYKKNVPGFEYAHLRMTPPHVGIRETRQISGLTQLGREDVAIYRKQPESTIARGCWFFDIHCPRGKHGANASQSGLCSMECRIQPDCYMRLKYADQMLETPQGRMKDYYDIPYGTIVPRKTKNLLVSGRCISADHYAMSSARVIATCMAIGEAAGTAAYAALDSGSSLRDVNVAQVQKILRNNGVPLGSD
jgi:hypothetical protein